MMNVIATLKACIVCSALLLGACDNVTAAAPAPQQPKTITTLQQGIHQWPALDGKLVLLVGTLTDTTSYKQSLTFYMVPKGGVEWLHVPIKEGKDVYTVSWMNVNEGDSPELDAIVTVQDKHTYLIVAGLDQKNDSIKLRTFKLVQHGTDVIDEPTYLFKQVADSVQKQANRSVGDALKKEAQRKLTK